MKVCIRAHDLDVTGTEAILQRLKELDIDGVQMVCYKAYPDIPYAPGAITLSRAREIGEAFSRAGKCISLVGAYFNPIHENKAVAERSLSVFRDYLGVCQAMGCQAVGSETGSRNNDQWTYHPGNRTEESLQGVVRAFTRLREWAQDQGSVVAMEGAADHVCWDVDTLARAISMVGGNTRAIFDLYNFMDRENQGRYMDILDRGLDAFAGNIQVFHMKDCVLNSKLGPRQVPFGKGELDIPAILRRIKAFDPNAVLVLEGTTGEDIGHAVQTVRTVWDEV